MPASWAWPWGPESRFDGYALLPLFHCITNRIGNVSSEYDRRPSDEDIFDNAEYSPGADGLETGLELLDLPASEDHRERHLREHPVPLAS